MIIRWSTKFRKAHIDEPTIRKFYV
jgi:hypothetical protein